MKLVCVNGNFVNADDPVLLAGNRGFRYGDGLFETIKVFRGNILFEDWHFERLFLGLQMLQIHSAYDASCFRQQIIRLCEKNGCADLARVRLALYRLHENEAGYIIEAEALGSTATRWNNEGLALCLYPYARKSADAFANLKTANFLPYVMAGIYAKEKGCDDAVVLNASTRLADTSKANLFLISKGAFFTPALHEGCINGVMRRYLIDALKREGYPVHQSELSEDDLLHAEEVFLTNSIYDIRAVQSFGERTYAIGQSFLIYRRFIQPLYLPSSG